MGSAHHFHQQQVAAVSLMFLVSPCVLSVLQYHLSQIDEAVKYSDSKMDLDKLSKLKRFIRIHHFWIG